ncbi:hypothetical protein [Tunicatimonas pelagia]|uniref:hypothetical protein n=1 Tax=Tunicatimonas pelagia TaxID=931531 RepID=UPI0026652B29|nr:hypothetical protein [Tunicatimonas pelagia]WKN41477.1 hypothetical protein P0M28_20795 [Tunicatimonas pelagia]
MNTITHWEQKNAKIEYSPEQQVMLLTWSGFQNYAALTEAMNMAYDLIRQKDLRFWVSDHRNLEVLSAENQSWIKEEFVPKLLTTTPVKHVGIIVGEKHFTNASMNSVEKAANEANLPVQNFPNLEGTLAWFERSKSAVVS